VFLDFERTNCIGIQIDGAHSSRCFWRFNYTNYLFLFNVGSYFFKINVLSFQRL